MNVVDVVEDSNLSGHDEEQTSDEHERDSTRRSEEEVNKIEPTVSENGSRRVASLEDCPRDSGEGSSGSVLVEADSGDLASDAVPATDSQQELDSSEQAKSSSGGKVGAVAEEGESSTTEKNDSSTASPLDEEGMGKISAKENETEAGQCANFTTEVQEAKSILNQNGERITTYIGTGENSNRPDLDLRDLVEREPSWPCISQNEILDVDRTKHTSHIIAVSCYSHEVALGAAFSLIESHYADAERKLLVIKSSSSKGSYDEGIDIDTFLDIDSDVEQDRVILVDSTKKHRHLLESLILASGAVLSSTASELQNRRTTVIGVVTGELLHRSGIDQHPDARTFRGPVTHWHIPISSAAMLSSRFTHGKEEAAELSKELERQRREGLWPASEDALSDELLPVTESPEQLRRQIERRDQLEPEEEKQYAARTFPEKECVEQWVIVVALFFRRLTPSDLRWILERLLASETIEVEKKKQVSGLLGHVQEISEKVSRPMLERFREDPDGILRNCGLEAVVGHDGERVIVFSTPSTRSKLHRFVRRHHPMLVHNLFSKLRDEAILFDPSASQRLVMALNRTTVDRMLEDSTYYGGQWLRDSMIGLRGALEIESSSTDTETVILAKLFQALHHKAYWNMFCQRMSDLLRQMLSEKSLNDTVKRFLQGLLRKQEHRSAFDIVLFVSRDLQTIENFDVLYWFRQLIEQCPMELEEETYRALLRLTSRSHVRINEYLHGIQEWLPRRDLEPSRYSFAHRRALQFIMDFCLNTAEWVKEKNFGRWPTTYPLFRALQADPATEERIEQIVAWMHHPGLTGAQNLDKKLKDCSHHFAIAALLERWAWILEGIRPAVEAETEAVTFLDIWLTHLAEHAGRGGGRAMRDYWHQKQEMYLLVITEVPIQEREMRKRLKAMRKKVLELRRRFMELGRGGH